MLKGKLLTGAHPPHWHSGSSISERSCHMMLATLPAVLMGICQYGIPALGVLAFSVSWAMIWELLMNRVMKQPPTIGDGTAALTGLLFAMLLPATAPWWIIVLGTFLAIVIGKQIFGGLGCNPLNPALFGLAVVMISWKDLMNFNEALIGYELGFPMVYPLSAVKNFGAWAAADFGPVAALLGRQIGGLGSTFGLGLVLGGVYLMLRGTIRWEISLSMLAGVFITALLFNLANPEAYAGPLFHLLTGYTLIGAFFLATEDSSSPVQFVPMLLYGAAAGALTVLIRNIGAFVDGVVFAVLLMNVASPLLDNLRPKALGSTEHA